MGLRGSLNCCTWQPAQGLWPSERTGVVAFVFRFFSPILPNFIADPFGGAPITLELRLSVEDSPNSAGVVIDAIRCCKLARDRGVDGALIGVSAYFMKHPPKQMDDDVAREEVERFIRGETDGDGTQSALLANRLAPSLEVSVADRAVEIDRGLFDVLERL